MLLHKLTVPHPKSKWSAELCAEACLQQHLPADEMCPSMLLLYFTNILLLKQSNIGMRWSTMQASTSGRGLGPPLDVSHTHSHCRVPSSRPQRHNQQSADIIEERRWASFHQISCRCRWCTGWMIIALCCYRIGIHLNCTSFVPHLTGQAPTMLASHQQPAGAAASAAGWRTCSGTAAIVT
jgi:hypothetical protein